MTLVKLPGESPGKVRTLRSNHLSDVTLDVVECEEQLAPSIVIDQAWVFRDDYFIVKDQDHNLYTSVEVNIALHLHSIMLKSSFLRVCTTENMRG